MTFRICFVCSGNICRSPTAEVVLRSYLADAGLADQVEVSSAGTGDWHVGDPADVRSLRTLAAAGYDGRAHRARQFDPGWFDELDLVVALDSTHEEHLQALAPDDATRAKVVLLRSFDEAALADGSLDLMDPFYGGQEEFDRVLTEVEAACAGLVTHLENALATPDPRP
jgi:protein-tyrosine phosphatase